jgi:hypothetical protein
MCGLDNNISKGYPLNIYVDDVFQKFKTGIKGTVSRDFLPSVFFSSNNTLWAPDYSLF